MAPRSILPNRVTQYHFSHCRSHIRRFRVTAAQARDLQQRFTRARKHAKQIAFFGTSLSDDVGPVHAAGPTHRRARGREIQLRRGLEPVFPFFSGNFETDVFETRE